MHENLTWFSGLFQYLPLCRKTYPHSYISCVICSLINTSSPPAICLKAFGGGTHLKLFTVDFWQFLDGFFRLLELFRFSDFFSHSCFVRFTYFSLNYILYKTYRFDYDHGIAYIINKGSLKKYRGCIDKSESPHR